MNHSRFLLALLMLTLSTLACAVGFDPPTPGASLDVPTVAPAQPGVQGEIGVVTYVVDGDTIEVDMNGVGYRVRYVGMNTPERDEVCYQQAKDANAALVEGQTVTMVRDQSNTDRYGRLLRYIYVGDRFVNAELVAGGYAEVVVYNPDDANADYFRQLETQAASANLGCHPTGIFDDGSYVR
jgi:endonuclease YncB( thermonuclease family)